VVLVDGNSTQIEAVTAETAARGVTVTIVIDFIHVLEYLWKAAWSFFDKGEPAAGECTWHPDSHPLAAEVRDGRAVWTCPRSGHASDRIGSLRAPPGRSRSPTAAARPGAAGGCAEPPITRGDTRYPGG
jgi:hypothetical protein